MADTGYTPGSPAGSIAPVAGSPSKVEAKLDELKKDYQSYLDNKSEEIKEQQKARRYYHGSQWTADQIKTLNKRKQPVVTFNRIARKINAIIGLLERQRQDPRGYPRTPEHEEGAEVATAVVRYVLDEQDWRAKSPISALNGAVDGIGGVELVLEQGDRGDVEVGFNTVDPSGFFYDPRSMQPDFADALYMGFGKWADMDALISAFPDKEAEIKTSCESGSDLTSNPDSDKKWLDTSNGRKRLRLVDHWYLRGGQWHWCIYTGATILAEGDSPYADEKKRTICRYIMFSANVDQDGDRYGFERGLESSQDEVNQRRSKALHISGTRRVIVQDGRGLDIEKTRAESVRPDGVILYPPGAAAPVFDDAAKAQELNANLGFLAEAKQEIESYGFNPALMGTGVQDMSGRAIALQQQAGIAELGPYILAFKGWKLRVYRAIWNAVQQHWTAERWIRVTDDEQVAKFFAVNKLQVDPRTGAPAIVNQLGSLDVDIIMDEGPDSINMQADAYDTLSVMAQKGQTVPPEVLIELSPVTGAVKKKILDMIEKSRQQPPNPLQQQAAQLELADKAAGIEVKRSTVALNRSKAMDTMRPEAAAQPDDKSFERWAKLLDNATKITVAQISAGNTAAGADLDRQLESMLHFSGLHADAAAQLREQAHERAMLALQPPPAAQPQAAA